MKTSLRARLPDRQGFLRLADWLAVGVALCLIGVAVLLAMWAAHFMLFRGAGLVAWIGMIIVVQNVVSSLFNSHLFDFSQGWLYVFGVGVAGGTVLNKRGGAAI
jgi:O-antigen ligase